MSSRAGLMVSVALMLACDEAPGFGSRSVELSRQAEPLAADGLENKQATASDEPRFVDVAPIAPTPVTVGFTGDGIYVLPGNPDALVLLKTDESGALHLLQPAWVARNRWEFQLPGERLESSDPRLAQLIKVPYEGYYRLTRELQFKHDGRWLTGAIVQLGYDAQGQPILFIAQRRKEEQNVLFFSRDQLQWLEPLAWYEQSEAAPTE